MTGAGRCRSRTFLLVSVGLVDRLFPDVVAGALVAGVAAAMAVGRALAPAAAPVRPRSLR